MPTRLLGIILLVAGILIVAFGLNASESISDSISKGLTGRFTDKTMWYLIGGAALAIGGASLAFFGRTPARAN